jgi:arsenate reductase
MITIYTYKQCGTCQKALKYLKEKNITVTEKPIRETPPTEAELKAMLAAYSGNLKALFNISGRDYRAMNLKETLPTLSEDEALALLQENGNLVKRPFLIGPNVYQVGFKAEEWDSCLS